MEQNHQIDSSHAEQPKKKRKSGTDWLKNRKWELQHPPPQPLLYETPEALQAAVDLYWLSMDDPENKVAPTVTGMAYFLGFSARKEMYGYLKRKGYDKIIARALLRIESRYEQELPHMKNPNGIVFILKNIQGHGDGWYDKLEANLTGTINLADRLTNARRRAEGAADGE